MGEVCVNCLHDLQALVIEDSHLLLRTDIVIRNITQKEVFLGQPKPLLAFDLKNCLIELHRLLFGFLI